MPQQDKPTVQERMKEITGQIEQGIREVFESDKYKQYLSVMSRFHTYSPNNVMLIYLQKPNATVVAGFNKWKTSFGRSVKKGEKGIRIIAPVPGKHKEKEQVRDPVTDKPMMDGNGNPIMVERERDTVYFRPVTVFDVSQTFGRPLPQLASDLTGNVEQYREFLEALRRSSPVPIKFEYLNGEDGMFRLKERDILIQPNMSEVQTVDAIIHEIAHAKLHDRPRQPVMGEDGKITPPKSRETEEVEAESIAYAVCQYYGIQTGENSFPYIATWSKDKELSELKASLQTIRKTASDLIVDIDRNFRAVCKERGITPKVADKNPVTTEQPPMAEEPTPVAPESEPAAATAAEPAPEPPQREEEALFLVNGTVYLHVQESEDGYDYTTYDAQTKAELDGGILGNPDISLPDAVPEICEMAGIVQQTVERADLSLVDELQTIERQRWEKMYADRDTAAPRRYDLGADGTVQRTFNGKTPDQFTEEDVAAFIADTEAKLRQAAPNVEKAFYESKEDGYLIYQPKKGTPYEFEPYSFTQQHGHTIRLDDYNAVYSGPLPQNDMLHGILNDLFYQFNAARPADFTGHSMSVSDIIAIRKNGVVPPASCHFTPARAEQ